MYAAHRPVDRLLQLPAVDLTKPFLGGIRWQGSPLHYSLFDAPAPLDARVADIDNHIDLHGAIPSARGTTLGSVMTPLAETPLASRSTTEPTRVDSPWPV